MSTTTAVAKKPEDELGARAADLLAVGEHHVAISSNDGYSAAGEFIKGLSALLKDIDSAFDPIIKITHESHKTALGQKKERAKPIEDLKKRIGKAMAAFERLRKAERATREKEAIETGDPMALIEAQEAALPKVEGVSHRKLYKAKVVNLRELARAVADGAVPESYIEPGQTVLNGVARSLKEAFNVPGCVLETDDSTAASAS